MRQVIQKMEAGDRRSEIALGGIHLSHQTLYRGLRCLPGPRGCPGLHGRDRRERPGGSRALLPGSAGSRHRDRQPKKQGTRGRETGNQCG
jgi:hypothetical protein